VHSHDLQEAHYPCLVDLHFVKTVSFGSSLYDYISGDVAAYISSVLADVCTSHVVVVVDQGPEPMLRLHCSL
jgi:hypothetical protein